MNTITTLYEDDDVVVINKPSGLVVHSDGRTNEISLVDWILECYPEIRNVGEPLRVSQGNQNGVDKGRLPSSVVERPGIVHRIDRETSGALVISKNQQAFENLKKQFQERKVEKTYRAFVYDLMKEDDGVIDRAIGKSVKDFRLWSAQRGARGVLRGAVTEYRVLERGRDEGGNPVSYVEVRPKTGRTHQIRVHFKAINHPVVCDRLYAPKRRCVLGFTRLALHALSLSFEMPSGKVVTAEAPLPDDFVHALSRIAKGKAA